MLAPIAYLVVIAVWATTPLAIKLSSQGFTPHLAVALRFLLASLVACVVVALLSYRSGLKLANWRTYVAASLGLFPNMPLIYIASGYISSGLMSVLFALAPVVMGLLSIVILRRNPFTPLRIFGLAIALGGLLLVMGGQMAGGGRAWVGIILMLVSTVIFSVSNLLVKKLDAQVDPLEQTLGAMVCALPGIVLTWYLYDGELPAQLPAIALGAVVYLALVGSLLGFLAFYYVLRTLPVEMVGIVPLITPVLALALGAQVAGETLDTSLVQGALLILLGLVLYELVPVLGARRLIVIGRGARAAQDQQAATHDEGDAEKRCTAG